MAPITVESWKQAKNLLERGHIPQHEIARRLQLWQPLVNAISGGRFTIEDARREEQRPKEGQECPPHRCPGCGARIVTSVCLRCQTLVDQGGESAVDACSGSGVSCAVDPKHTRKPKMSNSAIYEQFAAQICPRLEKEGEQTASIETLLTLIAAVIKDGEFNQQDLPSVVETAEYLFDEYVVPHDIPYVPESIETNLIEPFIRGQIKPFVEWAFERWVA